MLRFLLKGLLKALYRVRIEGHLNAFEANRLLIIANHVSFLDGMLLALFLPVMPVFVVYTGILKNRFFRLLLSQVDHLTVDPTHPMAMKKVVKLLESGRPVLIFPEGRITTTGTLMKVYEGPAFAAQHTGATLVPVYIENATLLRGFAKMEGKYPKKWFPQIALHIQPPTHLPHLTEGSAKERRRIAGESLRKVMQKMVYAAQPKTTLYTQFLSAYQKFGKKWSIVEDLKQEVYDYGTVLKMTLMLGRVVSAQTQEKECIGLLLPNLTPTLALVLGLTARNRTVAMLNYTAGVEGFKAACQAATLQTIVTSKAFIEQAQLADKLAHLTGIRFLYLEDIRASITLKDKLWLVLLSLPCPTAFNLTHDPDAPAVTLFTSGSEGLPKGVVLSHRALLANVAQIQSVIDLSVEDHFFNALPLFHAFGLTAGGLLPLLTGTRVFLYPSPLHYRIIPELVYDRGCTVLFGTSTFLGQYARFAHPYDFYRLRHVVAGAEKLSSAVKDTWFEKFGVRILEGYGATETAPVLAVNTPMAFKSGSVGQFLPGIDYHLEPVTGIEEGGILHVRGENLMLGYLRATAPGQLEPTASEQGAGWYNTGDVVKVDQEGFVFIQARLKRFAKIAGEMVSLETVEALAVAASPHAQHAATAIPDERKGEKILLFTTDPTLNRAQLPALAKARGISELSLPRTCVYVKALPLLGTGKVDYVRLKAEALAYSEQGEHA